MIEFGVFGLAQDLEYPILMQIMEKMRILKVPNCLLCKHVSDAEKLFFMDFQKESVGLV